MSETILIKDKKGNDDLSAFASIVNTLISGGSDVIKELIRTAQSNPLVGVFLVYLLTDLAVDKNVLHTDSAAAIKVMIAAAGGIALTAEFLSAIGSVIPLAGVDNTKTPSLFTPSATTIVNSVGGSLPFDISKEVGK